MWTTNYSINHYNRRNAMGANKLNNLKTNLVVVTNITIFTMPSF